MVKFSKQFEGQLIPEWKDAFVDYWELKKDVKRIHLLNNDNLSNKHQECSLPSTFFNSLRSFSLFGHQCRDHGIIQVHKKLASSSLKADMYKTDSLTQFAEMDAANEFFARLDHQLNKVNQFYTTKEKEFTERGESVKKQMDILIELKTALKQQGRKAASAPYLEEDSSISSTISFGSFERNDEQFSDSSKSDEMMEPMKTEREDKQKRTLSNHTSYCLVWEDLVNQRSKKCGSEGCKLRINKTKLHHAEKIIRGAFTDLFKGLGYLKTYRNLNMLAFVKILKKFDKVTGKQVLPVYHKVVESSYFNSSDKVVKLADEVEELFIKHFADNDKRKAMKYLRPHQRKDSHAVTFFIGLFTGCFVALFSGYIIMAHISGIYTRHSDSVYMETVYPVLSMFSLLFLHFFLYGCNIFMWKRSRINYSFIFELSPTKELKCRDVFLICTLSMATVLGVMFVHLTFIARGNSSTHVQAIPGFLLLIFLLLLVCPFNIFYRSSRYHFVRVKRNIILSPFYKVVMLDFFMADQLCSQVPMLRSFEYLACYYITGRYRTQDYGFCKSDAYKDLSYAVSFLPYYWRAMQCARRWFDDGETSHLINLGKYVSAMLAAGAKVAYEKEGTIPWLCLFVVTSSVATLYHLYWDFVKDWGLLQFNSKNPWLRNELMLRRKIIYFFSMGVNLVLRLAWLQTVLHSNVGSLEYRVTTFLLAALEVIRRGQWNFYRLENEHLNNAGMFRAVKTVPLPFQNADEQD